MPNVRKDKEYRLWWLNHKGQLVKSRLWETLTVIRSSGSQWELIEKQCSQWELTPDLSRNNMVFLSSYRMKFWCKISYNNLILSPEKPWMLCPRCLNIFSFLLKPSTFTRMSLTVIFNIYQFSNSFCFTSFLSSYCVFVLALYFLFSLLHFKTSNFLSFLIFFWILLHFLRLSHSN